MKAGIGQGGNTFANSDFDMKRSKIAWSAKHLQGFLSSTILLVLVPFFRLSTPQQFDVLVKT